METDDGHTFILTADVMFAYNKATLTNKARHTLTDIAAKLTAAGPAQLMVTGHTDSRGSASYNHRLSTLRAEAVAQFLAARLPATTAIHVLGKGESSPRATNSTAPGRALNRRVELTIPS